MNDETRQNNVYLPPIFVDGLEDNYLGNPDVVQALVLDACRQIDHWLLLLANSKLTAKEFDARVNQAAQEFSDIFSARTEDYIPIAGWNSFSLPIFIKTELKHFYHENAVRFNDDPLAVLYGYLVWAVNDAFKRTGTADDSIAAAIMAPRVSLIVNMLIGTARQ